MKGEAVTNKKEAHDEKSLTRKKILIGIPIALVGLFVGANLLGIMNDAPLSIEETEDTTPLVINGSAKNAAIHEKEKKILEQKVLPTNIILDKAIDIWEQNRRYTILTSPNTPANADDELNVIKTAQAPLYKPNSYPFYLDYPGGTTITVRSFSAHTTALPSATDKDFRETVESAYISYGLKKITTYNGLTDIYVGKGLVCSVDTLSRRTRSTIASCGTLTAYEKEAKNLAPIAALLPKSSNPFTFTDIVITSVGDKTKQATMNVGHINSTEITPMTFQKPAPTASWRQLN